MKCTKIYFQFIVIFALLIVILNILCFPIQCWFYYQTHYVPEVSDWAVVGIITCLVIAWHIAKNVIFWIMKRLFPDLTLWICVKWLKKESDPLRYEVAKCINSVVDRISKHDCIDRDKVLKPYNISIKVSESKKDTFDIEYDD